MHGVLGRHRRLSAIVAAGAAAALTIGGISSAAAPAHPSYVSLAPHGAHVSSHVTVTWDPSVPLETAGGHPTSASCPTASFCAEVDLSGNAIIKSGGTWSAPSPVDSVALTSVSCASARRRCPRARATPARRCRPPRTWWSRRDTRRP